MIFSTPTSHLRLFSVAVLLDELGPTTADFGAEVGESSQRAAGSWRGRRRILPGLVERSKSPRSIVITGGLPTDVDQLLVVGFAEL